VISTLRSVEASAQASHDILRGSSEIFNAKAAPFGNLMAAEEEDVDENTDGVKRGYERDFAHRLTQVF
jgi:hypothetical protein